MMKSTVKTKIIQYLKEHFIKYVEDVDGNTERIIVLYPNYPSCPGGVLEACFYLCSDVLETRVYYSALSANWIKKSDRKPELYRLLNYINATVFPTTPEDGLAGTLYTPSYLYAPKLYITEDGCYDITYTTVIPYDFFEIAPLETLDFLTVTCPELLNRLSAPIFFTALGKCSADKAISIVDERISSEK